MQADLEIRSMQCLWEERRWKGGEKYCDLKKEKIDIKRVNMRKSEKWEVPVKSEERPNVGRGRELREREAAADNKGRKL